MTARRRTAARLGIDPRAALGLVLLVGGTLVWVLTFTNTIPGLFQGSGTIVKAGFANAEGVVPNDPVRIDGVDVGHVTGVTLDPDGRGATVAATLNGSAPEIHRDASASIRWRTLLGGDYAIALDPGTSGAPALGSGTLPESQTSDQVELDEITRVVHHGARQGLRTMLQQLGPAFGNHQAPARAFDTLASVAPTLAAGMGALRGVHQDTDLRGLVRAAGQAASALDAPDDGMRQFVHDAATTFRATAASASDIRATIAGASTVLPHMRTTLTSLDHTLALADPLIDRLIPVAPSVAPTLVQLRPTVIDAGTLLRSATPLLHSLRRAVSSLASASHTGVPVLRALAPSLQQLDTQILPNLDRVSPESKHTVYEMIGPTFVAMDGIGSSFDQNGFYARLTANAGAHALDTLPCTASFADPRSDALLTCDTVLGALQQVLDPQANTFAQATGRLEHLKPTFAQALLHLRPHRGAP